MQKRLSDLFGKPISGEWGTEPSDGTGVNVLRSTNFSNIGKLDVSKEVVVRDISEDKIKAKRLKVGDLIIEKSGGSETQPVGRVVYFDIGSGTYLCNNFTSILRPKSSHNPKFLLYLMLYLYQTNVVTRYQNKTTGIINLKLADYLEDTIVEVPPLDTQNRIADALDKGQDLIDKRQEQIEMLDEFLQSVFLDMFGDPVSNPRGWPVEVLGSHINVIGGFAFKSSEFVASGVPVIKIGNVNKGVFDASDFTYWAGDYGDKLTRYEIFPGDILISLTGTVGKEDYGNICIVDDAYDKYLLNQRVAKLELSDSINKYYLEYCFEQPHFKRSLIKLGKGIRQANISNSNISSLIVPLPPIEKQAEFSEIVEQAEGQKRLLNRSLAEMQNLFNSIMQRAFKGELFN